MESNETQALDLRAQKISQSLRAIAEWLETKGFERLEDDAVAAIDSVLSDYSKRTKVFLVAASQKEINSMLRWMEAADSLEDRLLDPAYLETVPLDEARKILDTLHKKIMEGKKFLLEILELQAPRHMEDDEDGRKSANKLEFGVNSPVFEDKNKREKVQRLIDDLRLSVKKDESESTSE